MAHQTTQCEVTGSFGEPPIRSPELVDIGGHDTKAWPRHLSRTVAWITATGSIAEQSDQLAALVPPSSSFRWIRESTGNRGLCRVPFAAAVVFTIIVLSPFALKTFDYWNEVHWEYDAILEMANRQNDRRSVGTLVTR